MSKTAFIFPGQGAQYTGMGKDFYEEIPVCREMIDLAGEVTGLNMPALLFEENEELNITEYTQIAMLSVEVAMDLMKAERADYLRGVIHCYSYSLEHAKEYMNMGYYLGIGGVVTFKNAKKLKEVVEYAPLDYLLLETDSPYLAPEPYRGKRNCSLYLNYVAEEIARIKKISYEEVVETTKKNAQKLFGVK